MKRIAFQGLALSVLLIIALGCQKKPDEQQLFDEARKLQEGGQYKEAVAGYEKLLQFHPRGKYAPQAQFMVGFISANELKDLEKAEKAYKAFLGKYADKADSGMVASAEWELKNLGKDINQIEDLSRVMGNETQPTTHDSTALQPPAVGHQ